MLKLNIWKRKSSFGNAIVHIIAYLPNWCQPQFYTTRPRDLVMPDPLGWLFSQDLDYFRPYKNQVETDYKGYPIEFMVNFFRPFRTIWTIEDNYRPYWKLWDHFSKYRPSRPMLSISRNVRLSVCPSVCVSVCSLLRYRLNVFLPPLPEVGCPIFLEIRNPWGKVMERSGLIFEHFWLKIVKNFRTKKSFFLLILPYKTWWKPRFPMD